MCIFYGVYYTLGKRKKHNEQKIMAQKLKTALTGGVICGITGGISAYLGYFRFIHPYFAPHRTILAGVLLSGMAFLLVAKYFIDKKARNTAGGYGSEGSLFRRC